MIIVTCAIIVKDEKILVTQRSEQMKHPLKWEFPGGKMDKGETETDCIRREIREELSIDIRITKKLTPIFFDYVDIQISLIPFIADYSGGNLRLTEHKDYKWVKKQDLPEFDWVPADILVLKDVMKFWEINKGNNEFQA